jgi:hypothetical protein
VATWAELRAQTRALLQDTDSASYNWSDDELLDYANWALDDLSGEVPKVAKTTLTSDDTTTEFALPAGYIKLIAANMNGVFLPAVRPGPDANKVKVISYMLHYPEENYISFTEAPTEDVVLTYHAQRTAIALATDTVDVSGNWMLQAIAFYCGYLAHMREGVPRASLEQWATKRDLPVGNPLNLEAMQMLSQYKRLVSEHKAR